MHSCSDVRSECPANERCATRTPVHDELTFSRGHRFTSALISVACPVAWCSTWDHQAPMKTPLVGMVFKRTRLLQDHSRRGQLGWKGTPGFSKGESWIPAGTRGTLGSRSCRSVPLESDVNFQLKQSNRGFSFSASHLIWILASPPGIAGFRAGRPAARNPAEVVTSVLLGTHEHTRKTNCLISADQALHPVRT